MKSPVKGLFPVQRAVSLRSGVSATLVKAVLNKELKEGDKLIVRKLADQLGVSATPVREALVELEAIGIVQVPVNQSAVIKPFGPRELYEVYHIRGLLEVEATRLACSRLPREKLVQLEKEFRSLLDQANSSDPAWVERAFNGDRELHRVIAHYCGSGRLFHEISRYVSLLNVIGELQEKRDAWLNATRDHLSIVEALLIPDETEASRRMGQHVHQAALSDIKAIYGAEAARELEETSDLAASAF
jgi:DNA-binding GntR family transcriptional regulator